MWVLSVGVLRVHNVGVLSVGVVYSFSCTLPSESANVFVFGGHIHE